MDDGMIRDALLKKRGEFFKALASGGLRPAPATEDFAKAAFDWAFMEGANFVLDAINEVLPGGAE